MKVLNLYAGIGGNRKLWPKECEVTAVENNKEIADLYKEFFPEDTVIVADAHKYLLDHYKEFDFIWSSPPCPSHSKVRHMASKAGSYSEVFPDMKLYAEIVFLQHFCQAKWVVENVVSYYKPLIKPSVISRHQFWSNFPIPADKRVKQRNHNKVTGKTEIYGFSLNGKKIKHRKDQIIRNMVCPEIGLYVFECAFKVKQKQLITGE